MKKKNLLPLLLIMLFTQCSKNKDNDAPDLEKGLKGWFKLDGAFSDFTSHISSTGHDGNISFVADRNGVAQGAASFEGGYFWFDFPEDFSAIPMSISFWIKPKDLQSDAFLIKAKTAAFAVHQIDDRVGFVVSTPVTDGFATKFTTAWTHIVGTYDGNDVRLYINGEFTGYEVNPGVPDPTTRVEIGSFAQAPFQWQGALDDIRFYNRLLTQQEIKMLYEN